MEDYENIDPEQYENIYTKSYRGRYAHAHWYPLIKEEIAKYCTDRFTLDLACGTGIYTALVSEYTDHVMGLDSSSVMLKYARNKYPGITWILADAHHIPLGDNTLEAVVCKGLLEYVEKTDVLQEIRRILKPNGTCIIQCPNKISSARVPVKLVLRILMKKYVPREPSYNEVLRLFKRNDFTVVSNTMDDGLVYIPSFFDGFIKGRIYPLVERIFEPFGRNPFSNAMLFFVKKV